MFSVHFLHSYKISRMSRKKETVLANLICMKNQEQLTCTAGTFEEHFIGLGHKPWRRQTHLAIPLVFSLHENPEKQKQEAE